ncbi:hypothetical protein SO802_029464 [Lithocarpus litseifolius]|uniref:Uncharacterized protein n=1 Tax=Lithocarpus litseifolius TaxID=425828 RepID=A0AAW2BT71_9ROSI
MKASLASWWRQRRHDEPARRLFLRQRREHDTIGGIAREPEPELWKESDETGGSPRVLDTEKSFYYHEESLRQALADDLHQRLSTR